MGRDYIRGGRGREGGRDGRGNRGGRGIGGRFQGRRNWSKSSKQPEMKFFPHGIGRERQTVSFDTVKDHIVQYVQKTYMHGQDTAVSIRTTLLRYVVALHSSLHFFTHHGRHYGVHMVWNLLSELMWRSYL